MESRDSHALPHAGHQRRGGLVRTNIKFQNGEMLLIVDSLMFYFNSIIKGRKLLQRFKHKGKKLVYLLVIFLFNNSLTDISVQIK